MRVENQTSGCVMCAEAAGNAYNTVSNYWCTSRFPNLNCHWRTDLKPQRNAVMKTNGFLINGTYEYNSSSVPSECGPPLPFMSIRGGKWWQPFVLILRPGDEGYSWGCQFVSVMFLSGCSVCFFLKVTPSGVPCFSSSIFSHFPLLSLSEPMGPVTLRADGTCLSLLMGPVSPYWGLPEENCPQPTRHFQQKTPTYIHFHKASMGFYVFVCVLWLLQKTHSKQRWRYVNGLTVQVAESNSEMLVESTAALSYITMAYLCIY